MLAVVGNKSDCASAFDFALAEQFAEQIGALVFKTSAKTGDGVQGLFESLAAELLRKHELEVRARGRENSLNSSGYGAQSPLVLGRGPPPAKPSKGGCC